MMRQNEQEEIIKLIHDGFELDLISFELDIPIEQIQRYKEQLELRRFAKESIKTGQIQMAIDKLSSFIQNTENNIIERVILLKLQAYMNRTTINEEELQKIEEEKKKMINMMMQNYGRMNA